MQHFKDFIIKLQTIDIKVTERNNVRDDQLQPIKLYDISHQNPFLSASFKNEMRELKELAITDILNLSRDQIVFQLNRLEDIREKFRTFWHNYYHSDVPVSKTYSTEFFSSLHIYQIFIAPHSYYADHAQVDNNFINDLEDTIRAREDILEEFKAVVTKAIGLADQAQKNISIQKSKEPKARPVFKKEIIREFFGLIKDYFSSEDQELLLELITSSTELTTSLLFNGPGNQLADAFKQLFLSNLIVGCNKAELENWIQNNFQYRDSGIKRPYTDKYLQDIISSNTKSCQSPLFDVKKSDNSFYLSPLQKNNKNQKK